MNVKRSVMSLLVLLSLAWPTLADEPPELRVWKATTGHTIKGLFYRYDSNTDRVTILVERTIPMNRLSSFDQEYVKDQLTPSAKTLTLADWKKMKRDERLKLAAKYVVSVRSRLISVKDEEVAMALMVTELAKGLDALVSKPLSPQDFQRSLPETAHRMMKDVGWIR